MAIETAINVFAPPEGMEHYQKRLESFVNWNDVPLSGLGLKHWTWKEDPLEIHGRFFPDLPGNQDECRECLSIKFINWSFSIQLESITKKFDIERKLVVDHKNEGRLRRIYVTQI